MQFSKEVLTRRAVVLATIVALGGCASASESPKVPAKLREHVEVVVDGEGVLLDADTVVSARCVADYRYFALAIDIQSGPYEGESTRIRRSALEATGDPFGAWNQDPQQDPFGPLPSCD